MRKLIDLHPVLDLITSKLNSDRQELRRILDARNLEELRDFDEQDRLLSEIPAGPDAGRCGCGGGYGEAGGGVAAQ